VRGKYNGGQGACQKGAQPKSKGPGECKQRTQSMQWLWKQTVSRQNGQDDPTNSPSGRGGPFSARQ